MKITPPESMVEELHTWNIPSPSSGEITTLTAHCGSVTLIVGANGAGKSSLAGWLHKNQGSSHVVRFFSHRSIARPQSTINLDRDQQRSAYERTLQQFSLTEQSRFQDSQNSTKFLLTLFRLTDIVADENARGMGLFDERQGVEDVRLIEQLRLIRQQGILTRVSRIMKSAGMDLQFEGRGLKGIDVNKGDASYGFERMSDGERAAFLLAVECLLEPPHSIFIVDEPERHLHRSVSSKFLDALVEELSESHFIFLTHDLDTAREMRSRINEILVVRETTWANGNAVSWDIDQHSDIENLGDGEIAAIIGARKNVMFVEGTEGSLDLAIFQAMFPGWDIIPSGSCAEVIRRVEGLRSAMSHHRIQPVGLVDGDLMDDETLQARREKGIFALKVNEVESIYYHPIVLREFAKRFEAQHSGSDGVYEEIEEEILKVLGRGATRGHLIKENAVKLMTRGAEGLIKERGSLDDHSPQVEFEVDNLVPREAGIYDALLKERNLARLVEYYSVKDSPVKSVLRNYVPQKTSYAASVSDLVRRDAEFAKLLREYFVPEFDRSLI